MRNLLNGQSFAAEVLSEAIDQEVARYVVACERHDMHRAHIRYGALKRLRSAQYNQQHPM